MFTPCDPSVSWAESFHRLGSSRRKENRWDELRISRKTGRKKGPRLCRWAARILCGSQPGAWAELSDEPRASHCHCPLVMSGSGEQKEEDDGKGGEKHRRRKQNERMR